MTDLKVALIFRLSRADPIKETALRTALVTKDVKRRDEKGRVVNDRKIVEVRDKPPVKVPDDPKVEVSGSSRDEGLGGR